jgi:hypothetical protein
MQNYSQDYQKTEVKILKFHKKLPVYFFFYSFNDFPVPKCLVYY